MDYKERVAYLEALIFIATIDENVEEEELVHFNHVGELYGIEANELDKIKQSVINKEKTIENILKEIKSEKAKLSLIYDLLTLCYADGSYDILEKQGMRNISNTMGLEESKLVEMEGLIIETIELQNKTNKILKRN